MHSHVVNMHVRTNAAVANTHVWVPAELMQKYVVIST